MSVTVTHDGKEFDGLPAENCCLCRAATRYWYTPRDVALCRKCASNARPRQIPTKKQWLKAEDEISAKAKQP